MTSIESQFNVFIFNSASIEETPTVFLQGIRIIIRSRRFSVILLFYT
jgi:hypothetical protein